MRTTEGVPRRFEPTASRPLLLAHTNPTTARTLTELLGLLGHTVRETPLADTTPTTVSEQHPDALLVLQPGRAGLELCARLAAHPTTHELPLLLIDDELAAEPERWRAAGAADCVALGLGSQELAARIERLLRPWRVRRAALEAGVEALFQMMQAYDATTAAHMRRVAALAVDLGRHMGVGERSLEGLQYAALLHDIGKVGVSPGVLHKPGALSRAEDQRMRQHPLIGEQIVGMLPGSKAIAWVVRYHHERWDGLGYPDRLRGDEIPLCARIVAVADAFDALTTPRPYQTVLTRTTALEMLQRGADSQWDAAVVAALANHLQLAPLERALAAA